MSDQEGQARPVGAELADLRRAAGLTGAELARRLNVSQAKISRIERGGLRAKPTDILAIGRAVNAPDGAIRSLLERSESERRRLGRWRPAGSAPGTGQAEIGAMEVAATELRSFQVAVPHGLMHTEGYARAVLSDYARPLDALVHTPPVPAGVTARMRRQEILADQRKVFFFVLAETALLHRPAGPAVMLSQVERIREIARQRNVVLRVLPAETQLTYLPLHDFSLLDDRVLIFDTMTTTVVSREKSDLIAYRRVFEYFWSCATSDLDAVLDRYARLYAELARPGE